MKRIMMIVFISLCMCTVTFANTFHQSMSGKVDAVSPDAITVSNKVYKFTPITSFRAHEKRGQAIYEVAADKSEIRPGQYVIVMANGQIAFQVIIARWRQ